ncbi:hypothetical protein BU17DRAFT_36668 [Hysterangium stoloniferum]|nr:hypothetical protein BU17DRAFT_36668 [Hysterangium stoloniferum]
MSSSQELPSFDSTHPFEFTQSPIPTWSYGDAPSKSAVGAAWAEGEKKGWTIIDTETEDKRKLYALMISGIIPRPIAFVSTISDDGVPNLAPFSWFNMLSMYPATVMISCTNGRGPRDTALNIKANKQFVVNIISEAFAEAANFTSVDTPPGHSEWPGSGLTMAPSVAVKPSRVKESAFSMECELLEWLDLRPPGTDIVTSNIIIGHVKKIHVRNDVLTETGTVDPALLRPLARLGDVSYATLGTGFKLPRPTWKDIGDEVIKVEERVSDATDKDAMV